MILNLYQILSKDEITRSSQDRPVFMLCIYPRTAFEILARSYIIILSDFEARFNIKICTRSSHLIMLVNDARNATKILSRSYNKVFIFLKQITKNIFVARYLALLMRYFKVRIGRGNLASSYVYFVCNDRKKTRGKQGFYRLIIFGY